jgi:cytoskeletal protein CcmA (bactofilin family)
MEGKMARASDSVASYPEQTFLGRSAVLRGDLSGTEDLVIEGQFEGTLNFQENCVTVGPHGQLKGEIRARQVIIQGAVNGNISAREKIEIRKTGEVVGDLVAAGIAIEDGAYFKGSIDIVRGQNQEATPAFPTASALKSSA